MESQYPTVGNDFTCDEDDQIFLVTRGALHQDLLAEAVYHVLGKSREQIFESGDDIFAIDLQLVQIRSAEHRLIGGNDGNRVARPVQNEGLVCCGIERQIVGDVLRRKISDDDFGSPVSSYGFDVIAVLAADHQSVGYGVVREMKGRHDAFINSDGPDRPRIREATRGSVIPGQLLQTTRPRRSRYK